MRIRLLGTAAGGGFPQWNCNCDNCAGVRSGRIQARPRTQSSAAVSADGKHWFLLNASPDVGAQIASFPPLGPPQYSLPLGRGGVGHGSPRGSGIDGVLITNADLDHTLGLFQLREGRPLVVYAGNGTRKALELGLNLSSVLGNYCGIDWRTPPSTPAPLPLVDGTPSGLSFSALALPGKPPKYLDDSVDLGVDSDSLGYRIVDDVTGSAMVFVPDLSTWTADLEANLVGCNVLLIDGTFWSDDEMARSGISETRASQMGHLPIDGPNGTLAKLSTLAVDRKVFVHINNTNPILRDESTERAAALAAGVIVGEDGMEFEI